MEVHSQTTYWLLLALCTIDFISITAQALAFQKDNSVFIAILGYLRLPYSFLVDSFYFNIPVVGIELFGSIIILLTTISVSFIKMC